MVETGRPQLPDAYLVQADTRRDQIGVEPEAVRLGDEHGKVVAYDRLAAGKPELYGTERTCLTEHPFPVLGGQLVFDLGKIERIGAVHAVQRTAVSHLCQQP